MGGIPIQLATLSRESAPISYKRHDIFRWKTRLFFLSEIGFFCRLGYPNSYSVVQSDLRLTDCCLPLPSEWWD